jgi:uncharacterized surface protein with fasciclin (FAS1) repeats
MRIFKMFRNSIGKAALAVALLSASALIPPSAMSIDETTSGKMSTAKTQDIINTLRNRGSFHKMLDGLDTAYDLDNKLKGKGPFTVFAADDKAWAKINQADQDTLFANKKKLAQVFEYEIVDGCLTSDAIKDDSSIKTMEGHNLKVSFKDGDKKNNHDIFVNGAKIKTADIRCSNGIIHIVDEPLMPALQQ